MSELPTRRRCEHAVIGPFKIGLDPDSTLMLGPFTITVGFVADHPCEVFVTARGKTGTDLDNVFYELGVTASKIMQSEAV